MASAGETVISKNAYERPELAAVNGLRIRTLDDPRMTERIRVVDDYCLLVKYSDNYYDKYVRPCAHQFNKVAFLHDILIGSCTARLELTEEEDVYRLYIMTIAVLAPYRRLGVGSHLLQHILDSVASESRIRISEVTLHVQAGSAALNFYKKFDFTVQERVNEYYTDLEERDAFLLSKVIPQAHFEQKAKAGAKGGKKSK